MTDVGLSRFCPLLYGPSRMSLLQSMCYGELSFFPLLYCLPLWCLATFPQLCLLNGISLYPEVTTNNTRSAFKNIENLPAEQVVNNFIDNKIDVMFFFFIHRFQARLLSYFHSFSYQRFVNTCKRSFPLEVQSIHGEMSREFG